MRPVISMICRVAARACFAMRLHVSCSCHNCSLLRWSLWITTLDGSLLWSPYLQFACSVEPYGSLLCLPNLCTQHPVLPTPHRKWFKIGIGTGKFLHWSSFFVMVLVGGSMQSWFPLTQKPWNLPALPGICAGPPPTFGGTSFQALQYWWWV